LQYKQYKNIYGMEKNLRAFNESTMEKHAFLRTIHMKGNRSEKPIKHQNANFSSQIVM